MKKIWNHCVNSIQVNFSREKAIVKSLYKRFIILIVLVLFR